MSAQKMMSTAALLYVAAGLGGGRPEQEMARADPKARAVLGRSGADGTFGVYGAALAETLRGKGEEREVAKAKAAKELKAAEAKAIREAEQKKAAEAKAAEQNKEKARKELEAAKELKAAEALRAAEQKAAEAKAAEQKKEKERKELEGAQELEAAEVKARDLQTPLMEAESDLADAASLELQTLFKETDNATAAKVENYVGNIRNHNADYAGVFKLLRGEDHATQIKTLADLYFEGVETSTFRAVGQQVVKSELVRHGSSWPPFARQLMVEILGWDGDINATEALVNALRDSDLAVRFRAAYALEALPGHSEERVRGLALALQVDIPGGRLGLARALRSSWGEADVAGKTLLAIFDELRHDKDVNVSAFAEEFLTDEFAACPREGYRCCQAPAPRGNFRVKKKYGGPYCVNTLGMRALLDEIGDGFTSGGDACNGFRVAPWATETEDSNHAGTLAGTCNDTTPTAEWVPNNCMRYMLERHEYKRLFYIFDEWDPHPFTPSGWLVSASETARSVPSVGSVGGCVAPAFDDVSSIPKGYICCQVGPYDPSPFDYDPTIVPLRLLGQKFCVNIRDSNWRLSIWPSGVPSACSGFMGRYHERFRAFPVDTCSETTPTVEFVPRSCVPSMVTTHKTMFEPHVPGGWVWVERK